MTYQVIQNIQVVRGLEAPIASGSNAVELIASLHHETGCEALVLAKECLAEEFFKLSTGLAGEVLQKFVNYQMRLAIVGDFSRYTSKPLKDFIYESNQGSQVGFWPDQDSALAWLGK